MPRVRTTFAPIDAGLTIFEKKDHKQLIKLASRATISLQEIAYQKFTRKWVHTLPSTALLW